MSRYERYDLDSIGLLRTARLLAEARGSDTCEGEDLAAALLYCDSPWLNALKAQENLVVAQIDPPSEESSSPGKLTLSPKVRKLLDDAEALAGDSGDVTFRHILQNALIEISDEILEHIADLEGMPVDQDPLWLSFNEGGGIIMAPDRTHRGEPLKEGALTEYGRIMTKTEYSHPIIGRERETEALMSTLLKFFKPNAVLVGEAGVGKTAVVEGLAQRIMAGDVPVSLASKHIVELSLTSMLAGTECRGQFEERLKNAIEEAEANSDVILFIDEIHMLIGAGESSGGTMDAANILKPALARGKIRMIGATTPQEYHKSFEKDGALRRRFQTLRIDEPSESTVVGILKGVAPPLEKHHGITVPEELFPSIVDLCRDEIPQRRFPDKALDLLDRVCSEAVIKDREEITLLCVRQALAGITGVTFTPDCDSASERLQNLEARVKEFIVGQDEAIHTVINMIRLCKNHMDLNPEKPDGVFLFTGGSGVGKTAMATVLAEALTGRSDRLIRLDMSGFSEKHTVSRLMGSPAGYVGSDEKPVWLESLSRHPSCVLLLDELEKAHPNVHQAFLGAFETGMFYDAFGRPHSLSNATVIATSNVKAARKAAGIGFGSQENNDSNDDLMNSLSGVFTTEFLNRFDEIVVFRTLTSDDIMEILDRIVLKGAQQMLFDRFSASLRVEPDAMHRTVSLAEPDRYGARELDRVFRKHILTPVISVLRKADGSGDQRTVVVDLDDRGELRPSLIDNAPDSDSVMSKAQKH